VPIERLPCRVTSFVMLNFRDTLDPGEQNYTPLNLVHL
jgi:hypothetical protein